MQYRAIGLMSGSSLDGLDIAFVQFTESKNEWTYEILESDCISNSSEWRQKLKEAHQLDALAFHKLNVDYAVYTATLVNRFIESKNLHFKVQLIGSHGHTVFHEPDNMISVQLCSGAVLAAKTGINVISDMRSMDLALGGQGAPIVPIGEKYLFPGFDYYLNIGGIANISERINNDVIGWDVCPANRVLNYLAAKKGLNYDENGHLAASGKVDTALLTRLNAQAYYQRMPPKSLANQFGDDTIIPLIESYPCSTEDALHTYCVHVAQQVLYSLLPRKNNSTTSAMLVTGGGAFNGFLLKMLRKELAGVGVTITLPDQLSIQYKEALVMAFLAVLRWREENTCLKVSTGADRNSIGGAVWLGQET